MNDGKTYKVIALVALILGAIGVTIGYAAFSNTLTITSQAEVHPDASAFNVDFSSSSSGVVADPVTPTLSANVTGFTATNASIDNSNDPVISNLNATFTAPGQSATYTFYAYNAGEYIAYLNSIVFSGTKTCTACNGITLSVKVGSEAATTTSLASISSHSLAKNTAEEIVVTISYAAGSAVADGNFTVSLPSIVLTYGSAD